MNLYIPENITQQLNLIDNEWIGEYNGYQLRSAFQPILTQSTHEVYGYEGLVRVSRHGEIVNPLDFFSSFTNDTELTIASGICASMHLRNFSLTNLTGKIFLNSHPTMFAQIADHEYTLEKIMERIHLEGFDAKDIVWEITEFKESDTEKLQSTVELFKRTGFEIAIDDYGQLESNEKRIELLQPNIIKLDRSLIRNFCDNHSILILLLAKMLYERGFKIILEGIETAEEHAMLQDIPHHFTQGYLYGKPTLAKELITQDTVKRVANSDLC